MISPGHIRSLKHGLRLNGARQPNLKRWDGPSIQAGKSTLISAPTGSGKTFAAFLSCIDHLVRKFINGTLTDQTDVVYVSPLKALSNDIQKKLAQHLAEIMQLAQEQGIAMGEIRVACE